ncbi:MAG: YwaF family protein [Eubacteriales bacterium]|nr:YwaF family protein [Eubacteriales bacterium]
MNNTMTEKQNNNRKSSLAAALDRHAVFFFGLLFFLLEVWKQCYLYFIVFNRHYQVWYLPWQLCSMPIYLCPLYCIAARSVTPRAVSFRRIIAAFLADFGLLGGVCALIVHSGFTFPDHPLLTLHGYVWHILLIALSLYITIRGLSDTAKAGFQRTLPLFFLCAAVAELLNICFHKYGDCDMFYISPYHLSSQPVFYEIDRMIGRIPGIAVYLGAVILGAYLAHLLLGAVKKP